MVQYAGVSLNKVLLEPLLGHLIADLIPKPNEQGAEVLLTEGWLSSKKVKRDSKQPGKKVKQMVIAGEEDISNINKAKIESLVPVEIQISALKVVNSILLFAGSGLTGENRVQLDKGLLKLALTCCNLPLSLPLTDCPPNLQDAKFRKALYKVFKSAIINNSYTQSPLLPYAMRLFNTGLSDPNTKSVMICREGLCIAHTLLHPKAHPIIPRERTFKDHPDFINPLIGNFKFQKPEDIITPEEEPEKNNPQPVTEDIIQIPPRKKEPIPEHPKQEKKTSKEKSNTKAPSNPPLEETTRHVTPLFQSKKKGQISNTTEDSGALEKKRKRDEDDDPNNDDYSNKSDPEEVNNEDDVNNEDEDRIEVEEVYQDEEE